MPCCAFQECSHRLSPSIHLHLILLCPLFSLPFTVPPLGKDPLRVELGHGTRSLMIREVFAGQVHVCEPTGGNVVQELLVALRDALDASSEHGYSVGGTQHHRKLVHLRGDTGDEIGAFAGDITIGSRGWPWDWLFRRRRGG